MDPSMGQSFFDEEKIAHHFEELQDKDPDQ